MKNKNWILVVCILGVLMLTMKVLNNKPAYGMEELIYECYSPDETVKLSIYQGPPDDAVMVDFYVVGEIEHKKKILLWDYTKKEMIFYKYHEMYKDAYWIDNENILIDGCKIDILNKETWVNDKR